MFAPTESAGVAVVTGGAGGLGRACVDSLLARGTAVAVVDRIAPKDLPDKAICVTADVTSPDQVRSAHEEVVDRLGEVSILVNAAGIARSTRFADISLDEWQSVLGVSITGTFLMTQACLPGMRAAGWGRIVNFSSTAGKNVSTLGGAHYTTAKAGLLGLTRALAKELGPLGITVNAVCPGLFETEMARSLAAGRDLDTYLGGLPVPRIGQPSEVGELVAFLASDQAAYITGASVDINGGELMV
ncbi:SDR family oxidoreductase [Kribbella capetownensis]|uniref:SDR family oxidoreductase n=1 Tax=Kribbella capetownensis TaxID=1572659 RepID=A0A4R0JUW6_9ACTN|nr:SDR family NAD(P)-dependent oxidoreductase [Kribbella capetownensis]TCC51251.1 SDR family oxidoreductase [Kribbella capetownensis]